MPIGRKGVNSHFSHVDWEYTKALNRIDEVEGSVPLTNLPYRFQIHPEATQIIDETDCQQARPSAGLVDLLQRVVE